MASKTPQGASKARLDNIADRVVSGRYGSGQKGMKSFRRSFMPEFTKGFGMWDAQGQPGIIRNPQGVSLNDETKASRLADEATEMLAKVTRKGLFNPAKVTKGFYSPFGAAVDAMNRFGNIGLALTGQQWSKELGAQLGNKSFSLSSPLSSGFVPFDLMPFVRTIYPVYTPFRNKLARTPGQGEYHQGKILSNITGSLPNNLGSLQDDSTSEFFGGSGFSAWPNPLPNSGSQTAYDIVIPYKFYALTEATSWLAQFAGQGFDDLYGLASLVLLQEFMLLEEHDILASSSQSLATPSAPAGAARTAGSGETVLTGVTDNVFVKVAAINYWGQTVASTGTTVAWSAGDVVDVTIVPSTGAIAYVIYTATGSSAGTYHQWTTNTQGGTVGGSKFTLQGALPTTGPVPLTVDSGTGASTRSESLISVLSGLAYNGGSGPYPDVNAGYFNPSVGSQFTVQVLQNAMQQMFNGVNGYFANPSEIVCSAQDAVVLANSIQAESVASYQLRIQQSEVAGVHAGVAVAGVTNPITRSIPEIVIHPYLPQGNAMLMSYTLPQTQNNLGNVVEMVMVQDYAQIGWPVIDPSFRQSILRYGTFFFPAPQYCALLQGLQLSATTPYS